MKKMIFLILLCGTCMGKDLFLTPTSIISADTFIADGLPYKIDGIQPPVGEWGWISKTVMEKMIKGKEFKFLYFPAKNKGKSLKTRHVYFGIYGKDGKPQSNCAVKLLQMGLAKFSRGSIDDNRVKPYLPAEIFAKENKLGIWSK